MALISKAHIYPTINKVGLKFIFFVAYVAYGRLGEKWLLGVYTLDSLQIIE